MHHSINAKVVAVRQKVDYREIARGYNITTWEAMHRSESRNVCTLIAMRTPKLRITKNME